MPSPKTHLSIAPVLLALSLPAVAQEREKAASVAAREGIEAVDRSEYGLQAGIFTNDLSAALAAFERIEVGTVVVNDVPTYRVDPMPYGGVKASGAGREGPRWAIEDYTEMRMLVLNAGAAGSA